MLDLTKLEIRSASMQDLSRLRSLSKSVRRSQYKRTQEHSVLKIDAAYLKARLEKGMVFVATIENRIVGVTTMMLATDDEGKYGHDSVTMVAPSLVRKGIGTRLFEARIKWAIENGVQTILTYPMSEEDLNFLQAMSRKFSDLEFEFRKYGSSIISLKKT